MSDLPTELTVSHRVLLSQFNKYRVVSNRERDANTLIKQKKKIKIIVASIYLIKEKRKKIVASICLI